MIKRLPRSLSFSPAHSNRQPPSRQDILSCHIQQGHLDFQIRHQIQKDLISPDENVVQGLIQAVLAAKFHDRDLRQNP